MVQVTQYTDTDAIRGSLGADASDVGDQLISSSNIELELLVDLDTWLPTHAAVFLAGNQPAASDADVAKKNYIRLYSQWFCAYELASRFLLFPQIISDGKNQMNRFAQIDLDKVKGNASARMAKYRGLLNASVNLVAASGGVAIVKKSVPDFDPVTNT